MARSRNNGDGVTRRESGLYQARIQVNGVRRAIYGKTRQEVRQKLDVVRSQAVTTGSLPNPGTRTVNDLLDAWLTTSGPSLRRQTVLNYVAVCDRHIRPSIGSVRLSRIVPYHVQKLYADLESRRTARMPSIIHAMLHRAFRLAVLWRWLPENPCDRVVKPVYHARRKDVWSEEQLGTFLNGVSKHRYGSLWVFLVSSGCRLGEALALTWGDIEGDTVRISKCVHQIKGELLIGEPKTEAGRRSITLPDSMIQVLRRQKAWQAEQQLRTGIRWKGTTLVFTTPKGAPLYRSTVCRALLTECRRLNVPVITPHGFRHLHASYLIAKGLPIPAVSARLGHSKVSITLDIYSHVVGGEDRRAADLIGKAIAIAG